MTPQYSEFFSIEKALRPELGGYRDPATFGSGSVEDLAVSGGEGS